MRPINNSFNHILHDLWQIPIRKTLDTKLLFVGTLLLAVVISTHHLIVLLGVLYADNAKSCIFDLIKRWNLNIFALVCIQNKVKYINRMARVWPFENQKFTLLCGNEFTAS